MMRTKKIRVLGVLVICCSLWAGKDTPEETGFPALSVVGVKISLPAPKIDEDRPVVEVSPTSFVSPVVSPAIWKKGTAGLPPLAVHTSPGKRVGSYKKGKALSGSVSSSSLKTTPSGSSVSSGSTAVSPSSSVGDYNRKQQRPDVEVVEVKYFPQVSPNSLVHGEAHVGSLGEVDDDKKTVESRPTSSSMIGGSVSLISSSRPLHSPLHKPPAIASPKYQNKERSGSGKSGLVASVVKVFKGRKKQTSPSRRRKQGEVVVSLPDVVKPLSPVAPNPWGYGPGSPTAVKIKPQWISLRYRLGILRRSLYEFRRAFTVALKGRRGEANTFLRVCDASKNFVDGDIAYFSSKTTPSRPHAGLENVAVFYFHARDLFNECVLLAQSLFMGRAVTPGVIYSTGVPFGETHLYPEDRVGLLMLYPPLCLRCSAGDGEGPVVFSSLLHPDALDFEDVCPECGISVLQALCDGKVLGEEGAFVNPELQCRNLVLLKENLGEAEITLRRFWAERS